MHQSFLLRRWTCGVSLVLITACATPAPAPAPTAPTTPVASYSSASPEATTPPNAPPAADTPETTTDEAPAASEPKAPVAGEELELATWCAGAGGELDRHAPPDARCRRSGPVCIELAYVDQTLLHDEADTCRACRPPRGGPIVKKVLGGACGPIRDEKRETLALEPWTRPRSASTRLCEQENPSFDATLACLAFGQKKFPGRECSAQLGPTTYKPMGSCRPCTVICK